MDLHKFDAGLRPGLRRRLRVARVSLRAGCRAVGGSRRVLHGVERTSLGEFYFIAGVTGLFAIAHTRPGFYVLPLLWLTFADATALLIGVKYGTIRYATHDGRKSIEGSGAFFVVAYITTFMGLVALGHVDVVNDALIAGIIGALTMLLEAVSWDGLDNAVIPIFGFALLETLIDASRTDLLVRVGVLAGAFALTQWQRTRTTLSDDALLGAALSGYAFWILGGWAWLVPPAIVFLKDKVQSERAAEPRRHDIHAVMATCGPGLLCALGNRLSPDADWFLAYALTFAVQFAIFEQTLLAHRHPQMHRSWIDVRAAALASVFMLGTYAAIRCAQSRSVDVAVVINSTLIVLIACLFFRALQPQLDDCPQNSPRWFRQAGLSTLGAGAIALLVHL